MTHLTANPRYSSAVLKMTSPYPPWEHFACYLYATFVIFVILFVSVSALFCGAPGVTRTRDLLIRSQTLYPTELRAHPEASISYSV